MWITFVSKYIHLCFVFTSIERNVDLYIVDFWDTKWLITTSLTGGTFVLSFVICIRLCLRYVNQWNNSINTVTFCVVILKLIKYGSKVRLLPLLKYLLRPGT